MRRFPRFPRAPRYVPDYCKFLADAFIGQHVGIYGGYTRDGKEGVVTKVTKELVHVEYMTGPATRNTIRFSRRSAREVGASDRWRCYSIVSIAAFNENRAAIEKHRARDHAIADFKRALTEAMNNTSKFTDQKMTEIIASLKTV